MNKETRHRIHLWERIRDALRSVWTDFSPPAMDEHTALVMWLIDTHMRERHLAARLRRDALAMPYEEFRRQLEAMAQEDDHHAHLLQQYLEAFGALKGEGTGGSEPPSEADATPLWRRLRQALADKRGLYERYREQASLVDDASLRDLLLRLKREEETHQDQLVELLMRVDSHVHSP